MALTALQQRFVETYSADPRNATQAYKRAGGAEGAGANVSASRLLKHPAIADAIQRQQQRFAIEQQAVRDDLFCELKRIIDNPGCTATEKLKAAELLCKMFGLL